MFKRPFAFLATLATATTLGMVVAPTASADTIGTTVWLNCSTEYAQVVGSVRYTTATNSNGARKIAKVEWKSFTSPVDVIEVVAQGGTNYRFQSSDGGHVAGYRNTSSALPYLQQPRQVYSWFGTTNGGWCTTTSRDY
jgi:ABC-type taurine transport system substrate-binding protein